MWGDYDYKEGKKQGYIKYKIPNAYKRNFFVYKEEKDIDGNIVKKKEEIETILPAARREYTEEVEFDIANPIDSMLDLGDAYLKEVLVETATMRSLGNDLGQLDSALFGMIDEDFGTSGMSDYLIPDAIVPSRNY